MLLLLNELHNPFNAFFNFGCTLKSLRSSMLTLQKCWVVIILKCLFMFSNVLKSMHTISGKFFDGFSQNSALQTLSTLLLFSWTLWSILSFIDEQTKMFSCLLLDELSLIWHLTWIKAALHCLVTVVAAYLTWVAKDIGETKCTGLHGFLEAFTCSGKIFIYSVLFFVTS